MYSSVYSSIRPSVGHSEYSLENNTIPQDFLKYSSCIIVGIGTDNDIGTSHKKDTNAEVAELADALASGASGRKAIGVQLSSSAH